MFIGVIKPKRDYRDPNQYDANVTYGADTTHVNCVYFIMNGAQLMGVGRVLEILQTMEGTRVTFRLNANVHAQVKKFAEAQYRIMNVDGQPRSYADSAGTGYETSTMDGATAVMMGMDRTAEELAQGGRPKSANPSIAQMMGWPGADDDGDDW